MPAYHFLNHVPCPHIQTSVLIVKLYSYKDILAIKSLHIFRMPALRESRAAPELSVSAIPLF